MADSDDHAATLVAARSADRSADDTLASDGAHRRTENSGRLRRGDVLGRYVVLDSLGEGGMGVVYAAYDPELDRRVAIKLVKLASSSSSEGTVGGSRLVREAQAMAKLTHANVVAVYDVGTWRQSVFVAMEFIEGETVLAWVRRRQAEGDLRWREVLSVLLPAGRGLEAAHVAGIVHRDFKPENVMIASDDRVLVLDFGLARASEGGLASRGEISEELEVSGASSLEIPLTVTGSVMGTPAYMSPEQFQGEISDAASDQFSFCASLYHALYGERPFAGETLPELTHSVMLAEIRPAPRGSRVPAWLRKVVLRGLATDPGSRYPTMTELLAELSRDPARTRNRAVLAVGVVALAGGAWWGATRAASSHDVCGSVVVGEAMSEAWGAQRQAALKEAFTRDAKAYSGQALERVSSALDQYATNWVDLRKAACEAGRVAGTEASRDAALQAACLDQGLRRFDALVRLLGDADQQMVVKALSAVQGLPDPSVCEDPSGYRDAALMPDDPASQERVEVLRLRAVEAHALAMIGRVEQAVELSKELLEEARANGFDPVVAEMLYVLGNAQTQAGQYEAALSRLEEGLMIAKAHGLTRFELNFLSPIVFLNTSFTADFSVARWQIREMEALGLRLGDDPHHRARALVDRARLQRTDDDTEASIITFEAAIAILEELEPETDLVIAYDNLASSYVTVGRSDDAARVLEKAVALADTLLGSAHPHRGNLLAHEGRVAASRGNTQVAIEKLRASLKIFDDAYGGDHPNSGAVLNGLGLQLELVGQHEEAITSFRKGLEISMGVFGSQHEQVSVVQSNLGNILRRNGQAEEALALHRAALATREAGDGAADEIYQVRDNLGDDLRVLGRCDEAALEYEAAIEKRSELDEGTLHDLAYPRMGLGLCQRVRGELVLATGYLEEAVRGFEEKVSDAESQGSGPVEYLAVARFMLAVVLRARDEGSVQARELAEAAKEFWAEDPVQYRHALEELGAWSAGGELSGPVLLL